MKSRERNQLSCDFGEGLTVAGESPDGAFQLHCPSYFVSATSQAFEEPGWAIASPVNGALSITYGEPRPPAKVVAIINNFDFKCGNVQPSDLEAPRRDILRVTASDHNVDFVWRDDRTQLRMLLAAGILPTTALTSFSFNAWPDAKEKELIDFAWDVAGLTGIIIKQHAGLPVISFFDSDGKVIKRVVGNPTESAFRQAGALRIMQTEQNGLPQVFRQCFREFQRFWRSPMWNQILGYCVGIEDPPYLEQRIATLMSALELFLWNSLVESGEYAGPKPEGLSKLIGAARKHLWDIPRHYTAKEGYRELRNAVSHGGRLPDGAKETRREFDKWHLFLLRRLLIRLGYDGQVACPSGAFTCSSPVNDFSEEFNTFGY